MSALSYLNEHDKLEFLTLLFKALDNANAQSDLFFRTGKRYVGGEYATPASFFIDCTGLFDSNEDFVEVTPDNIDVLVKSAGECEAFYTGYSAYGTMLFCCRVRQQRPQERYLKHVPAELKTLFEECQPNEAH